MNQMKRRTLLAGGAALAGAACGCSVSGCKMILGVGDTPELAAEACKIEDGKLRIDMNLAPELGQVGGSVKITTPALAYPLIIARAGERDFVAAALKCTHGGRELEYRHQDQKFRCVSFGHSEFDLDGKLLKGPAETDIQTRPVSFAILKKDTLVVRLD